MKKRLILIGVIAVFFLALIIFRGINFGIEFVGGSRVPIILERSVSRDVMDEIVNNIKIRITKFGLAQVSVRSVGDRQIYVEIPTTDPRIVEEIEKIIRAEGKFEAIIDGKVALTGKEIVSGSIREEPEIYGEHVRWGVSFVITPEGSEIFGSAAYGKGNYPVHLFLDKVEDSIIVMKRVRDENFTEEEIKEMLNEILAFTKNEIVYEDEIEKIEWEKVNKTVVTSNKELIEKLKELNKSVIEKSEEEMIPKYTRGKIKNFIDEWPAIGLLSSPVLSENLASGKVGQMFRIEGTALGKNYEERREYALNQMKKIKSILSGGAIPVKLSLGSITTVPPSLGRDFLTYSIIGIFLAYVVVILITLARYKKIELAPVLIFVSASQIIILVGLIGNIGTIDLAGIAGLFATIGTSVDAQIVVADEVFSKEFTADERRRRIKKAFYIIIRDAAVLITIMIPLLFSNIVEVIGFVNVLLMGTILNILITMETYKEIIK